MEIKRVLFKIELECIVLDSNSDLFELESIVFNLIRVGFRRIPPYSDCIRPYSVISVIFGLYSVVFNHSQKVGVRVSKMMQGYQR